MSKGLQTFVSYKYLKDATGIQYLVVISHGSNPISGIISKSPKNLILTLQSSASLKDGNVEQVYSYTGSGDLQATFKGGQTLPFRIDPIPSGRELAVPFDSLERSFSFDASSESSLGYDIADSL